MSSDINLVAGGLGHTSKKEKGLYNLKLIATSLIVGIGVISVFLFILNRLFSPESIVKEQNNVRASILSVQEKQAKLIVLNQRLNDVSNIVSKRANYDIVLGNILSQSPSGIQTVSLAVDKGKISMIVSSNSLISINEFIEMLAGMVSKKEFLQNVTINSLSLNSRASSYTLTMELNLL